MKKLIATIIAIFGTATGWAMPERPILQFTEDVIVLSGEINSSSESDFIRGIMLSAAPKLTIFVDSPGGSVMSAAKMIQAMKDSGKETICYAEFAASAAFTLMQNCDKRYVGAGSILMQHPASYGLRATQAPQVASFNKMILSSIQQFHKASAERLELSIPEYEAKIRDDWWIYGTDNITEKVADALSITTCSADLIQKQVRKKVRVMLWTIDAAFSACPLLPKPIGTYDQDGKFTPLSQVDISIQEAFSKSQAQQFLEREK